MEHLKPLCTPLKEMFTPPSFVFNHMPLTLGVILHIGQQEIVEKKSDLMFNGLDPCLPELGLHVNQQKLKPGDSDGLCVPLRMGILGPVLIETIVNAVVYSNMPREEFLPFLMGFAIERTLGDLSRQSGLTD